MLHNPRPGEGIPESTLGDSQGSLEAQGQISVQNKGAWERCCGNRLEPCTAHLCPPYADSVETQIPPIFIVLLLGCSNSSQYRERAGRDLGIGHLMTFWDASAIPWAPWLFPAKAQTTCMRQVMGHSSRHHLRGHGQSMGQTAALKALPLLLQLHIHSSSVQTSVSGGAAEQRGSPAAGACPDPQHCFAQTNRAQPRPADAHPGPQQCPGDRNNPTPQLLGTG